MTTGLYFSNNSYLWAVIVTILSILVRFQGQSDAWWIRSRPVCPIGFVEVRGCVPLENMHNGAIKPFGGGHPQPPHHQTPPPPPTPPATTPPPVTTTEPTPPPCPPGYHGDLEGGWVCP